MRYTNPSCGLVATRALSDARELRRHSTDTVDTLVFRIEMRSDRVLTALELTHIRPAL